MGSRSEVVFLENIDIERANARRDMGGKRYLPLVTILGSYSSETRVSASSLLPDPLRVRDPTIPSKAPTSKDLRHSTSVCRAETLGVHALAPTELFTAVGGEIDEKLGSNSIKTFYGCSIGLGSGPLRSGVSARCHSVGIG